MVADKQLKKGFIRIANNIYEAIYKFGFSAREYTILLCIIRWTYGFNRKSHTLSLGFIQTDTGIARSHISKVLKKLECQNIVIIYHADGRTPQKIQLQKDTKKWIDCHQSGNSNEADCYQNGNSDGYQSGNSNCYQNGNQDKTIYNKDNIKDNISYGDLQSPSEFDGFEFEPEPMDDDCNNDDNNLLLPDLDAEFEKLWELYPRKAGKKDAKAKYVKARTRKESPATFEQVKHGIECYAEQVRMTGTDLKYVKHGSAWFNQEVWQDYDYDEDAHAKAAETEEGNKWQ